MYFYWVSLPSLSLEPSSVSSLLLSPSQFGAPVQSSRLEYFILLLISQVFLTESYFVMLCDHLVLHVGPSNGKNSFPRFDLWVNSLIAIPSVDLGTWCLAMTACKQW